MAIRIQFAGDRSIGIGSKPPGAFLLFKPPVTGGGPSCPPYGQFISEPIIVIPVSEGGESFQSPVDLATDIPNQVGNVPMYHDGNCGTYYDYSGMFNVQYIANGTVFWTSSSAQETGSVEVPTGSDVYHYSGYNYETYVHNGSGGWTTGVTSTTLYPNGTFIRSVAHQTQVPSSTGSYHNNGKSDSYYWDGTGSYYSSVTGSFYANGTLIFEGNRQTEVPSGSSNFYNTGIFDSYKWNGSGGYTLTSTGSYYSAGTLIYENITGDDTSSYYLTVDSVNYYSAYLGDRYTWDGSGGYIYVSSWYRPYGTWFAESAGTNYYWDGNGSYYTS